MKINTQLTGGLLLAVLATACSMGVDPGPTKTGNVNIDGANAGTVSAAIHMNTGELQLTSGAPKLLMASWKYSEKVGAPVVNYSVTGTRGTLSVESPKDSPSGLRNPVNEWTLQMGAKPLMDLEIHLGAGTSDIDVSNIFALRSMEVHMGAGEMKLNLAGKYPRDVPVEVNGGAGTADIQLPKDMGVEVEAKLGIGGINANGMQKRDGKYYNDAYAEGKPTIHLAVKGGVGEINLTLAN